MKSVVIIGASGFGRVTLEVIKGHGGKPLAERVLGFLDDNEELHGKEINGYTVLGGLDWLKEHKEKTIGCVVAISACKTRKHVVDRLRQMNASFYNVIDPTTIIEGFVEIGTGVNIQPNAIIRANAKIGDHVHINTTAIIGHDAVIGNYCTVAPKADVDGAVRLGEGVYVGSHGVILPGVSIGRWSTIGAGAIVTANIPENVTAVGIPAKIIKSKTP
jgi:sugar O-acyltransferase (sialic acid O-acetyltransferase NeuD family)